MVLALVPFALPLNWFAHYSSHMLFARNVQIGLLLWCIYKERRLWGWFTSERPWKDNVLSFLRQIFQDWGSRVSCVLTRGWEKKKAISERIQPGLNRGRCLCVSVCHSLLQGETCLAWGQQAQEEIRPGLWLDSSLEACYPGQDSLIFCANPHCSMLWSHSSCVCPLSSLSPKSIRHFVFPLEMFS